MGRLDRTIRFAIAAFLVLLYFTGIVGGIFMNILLALAAILILTSLFGSCPFYNFVDLNTCKNENSEDFE